ncbi:transcriptional regulator with XRE-family HTH domain [Clostridium pascui]|uniref:helix-turn-helix domain-containing protein n=1 Tax=Clostridium pascui TaxID=46609 RepID=UPI00195E01D2|nr:helix-turn-helix transcriptional regulator [Clostridium pascui]MBM7871970.1 transcriptional regulator with XRE-family HTH domain [Clostridium pascui]
MSRIGEKIKNIRIEKGLTQKQLGKKLGVAEGFINEVESGRKVINQSLIDRIGKVLGKDLNDITMSFEEEVYKEEKQTKFEYQPKKEKINDVWNEAFGSVIKNVPIYSYELNKMLGHKKMPIIENKIESFPQDKVVFLQMQDDEMMGFRIAKGDIAFANLTNEVQNNSICLVEYGNERKIRQIKILDSNKVLLISNAGSVRTETIEKKSLKIIAKLNKLEITL